MPKIIFEKNEKDLIPENLKDSAKELEDGTFELDAKGVLKKNKELLRDNASLEGKLDVAETAKAAAEARASEWKGKANLPEGKTIVDADVAELGEAAKTAGLVKDEIPTLKTAVDEKQKVIDGFQTEIVADEIAKALKLSDGFKKAAKKEGWKFEKQGEGEAVTWHIVAGENKPKVEDFLKEDEFYKEIDFSLSESGNQWVRQESGKDGTPKTVFDEIEAEMKEKQKAAVPKDNNSIITALGGVVTN